MTTELSNETDVEEESPVTEQSRTGPTVRVQTVLYRPAPGDIERLLRGLQHSVEVCTSTRGCLREHGVRRLLPQAEYVH